MSGYAGSPGESNGGGGLEGLFAQLRNQNQNQSSNSNPAASKDGAASPSLLQLLQPNPYFVQTQPQHGHHQPSASPALPTPPVKNQPPHHASAVMSPAVEVPPSRNMIPVGGGGPGNTNRTTNLLNLLKFSQPTHASTPSTHQAPISIPHPTSREPRRGNSDLLATLMGVSQSKENKQPLPHVQPTTIIASARSPAPAPAPSADTQAYLLQLLNRPKPSQTDSQPHREPSTSSRQMSRESSQDEVRDLAKSLGETLIDNKPASLSENHSTALKPSQGLFTYVNPFEELAASSPRHHTPSGTKAAQHSSATPPAPTMQILMPSRHSVPASSSDLKRKVDDRTPSSSPALSAKRKLESPVLKSVSPAPSPLPHRRSQLEALIGIGATGKGKETVSEALNDVSGQVDRQVEQALARAEEDESQATIEKDMRDLMNSKTEEEFEERAQIAAVDIKNELDKAGNENVLEEQLPHPVAQAVKDLIANTAKGNVVDSWESASVDEPPRKDDETALTPVFNLPNTPWQVITVLADRMDAGYKPPTFGAPSIMDVARLKKEFDQVDRTLVTATNDFIIYGMSKNGGIRVIRQQDGLDLKLFTETKDRVFNVSCSNSTTDATETVLGTGISGTVYWASIKGEDGDYVESGSPEKLGFALPPFKASGEESSGGVVKTRARKSSNHPEFFAVGRGKSIHIIWPHVIMKQGYLKDGPERLVDVEKYLSHRSLKINTGKAGKDFTFSPDDTTIVSLDKAGRVKFWDVRTLTQTDRSTEARYPAPEQISPVEIKEPMLTLTTTHTNEKSWPTSVMFVDKAKAYQKPNNPLRYLVVGMKQNHTLQLWDLTLGKPVQEINLPHSKESDAVCSVMYHPSTGMIVIGHPTRNSIYIMHLSIPGYSNHKFSSQADFINKLAAKEVSKPTNTCILSGMREYSLGNERLLRSLEILPSPTSSGPSVIDPILFELYAMHSKGVTCIYIKQEDLGWNKKNRVIKPIDALEKGLISMAPLPEAYLSESATSSPAATRSTPRILPKDISPKDHGRKSTTTNGHSDVHKTPEPPLSSVRAEIKIESPQTPQSTISHESGVPVSPEKSDKKKKRKAAVASRVSDIQAVEASGSKTTHMAEEVSIATTSANVVNGNRETTREAAVVEAIAITSIAADPGLGSSGLSQEAVGELVKNIGNEITAEFSGLVTSSFDTLYRRVDDDQRSQAAISDSKQEALLRLVSSTLSDNVEKTLSMIVSAQIKKSVIPNISQVAAQTVKEQLGTVVGSHLKEQLLPVIGSQLKEQLGTAVASQLKSILPNELQSGLPDVLTKTMQKPEVVKLISESVAQNVSFLVEKEFTALFQNVVVPVFKDLAIQAAHDASKETQRQAMEVIANIERKRQADNTKIDQLTRLVSGMGEMLSTMADTQKDFQEKNLRLWQQSQLFERRNVEHQREPTNMSRRTEAPESSRARHPSAAAARQPSKSQVIRGSTQHQNSEEEALLDEIMAGITQDMASENFADALMKWLQSDRQQEIFEGYFYQIDPSFIVDVAPLILLSIAATCTMNLEGKFLLQRLIYLEMALQSFQASIGELDAQTAEVTPKILGTIVQRLETLFMRISQVAAQDPLLKRVANLVSITKMMVTSTRR